MKKEKNKKRRHYKFTDKKHPTIGIVSVVLAAIVLVTILILCIGSGRMEGNGPLLYGVIGCFAMIGTLVGFILGLMSLMKKEVFYLFPILGTISNGILFLFLFILYIIGASI